jgi:hypothetical protein
MNELKTSALAEELAKAANSELLADMMVACGWTRVCKQYYINNFNAIEIVDWLQENCQGKFKRVGDSLMFERAEDATLFSLRWV